MTQISVSNHLAAEEPTPRHAHECPVENWLRFFGHRWNALVLWHLSTGPKRHGELMACLPGVTPKVLTERLGGLERHRLVTRSVARTFPRTVLYSVTEHGREIIGILDQIELWARAFPAVEKADVAG